MSVSEPLDLLIRAHRTITPAGETACAIGVRDGRIVEVAEIAVDRLARVVLQLAEDEALMPGLVDTHVHINEPGRTDWEGFASATRSAAAGGVTTVIDMPLNSIPPTCTVEALKIKRARAAGQVYIDVGFWAGAVPSNLGQLKQLYDEGVFGFKCFLLHSGVPEFAALGTDEVAAALEEIGAFDGLLIVHAEDQDTIDSAPSAHGAGYANFLASRPRVAENVAIENLIALARPASCRVHIVHLSSADALATIRAARQDSVRLSVETCPHYLVFAAEEIPDGATQFKCCPPIREAENRQQLWAGLADGSIDCVVSDHSPCTAELKRADLGDFGVAWGGVASLQLGLPAVWTQARERGFTLSDVVRWMACRPAELVGLERKGRIEVGYDADFAVFAPDESFTVERAHIHHKNDTSPYIGRSLTGVVRSTWLRGRPIARRNRILGDPVGTLLEREQT